MARAPVVAGQFYPAGAEELRSMIAGYTPAVEGRQEALGVLSPHAGYVFSGATAGRAFAQVRIPDTVILLTPSHRYPSPPCALWTGGPWETPLGEVALHEGVCSALAKLPMVTAEDRPHVPEHSGEVVLPFIQYHRPDVRMAVICVTQSATADQLLALGNGIGEVLGTCDEGDALVVASSDMSHEDGPQAEETVRRQDPLAIAEMERLDPSGLVRVCREKGITMCGVLPAAAMMACVKARGGTRGEVVHRATSADSPLGRGDYVVGYVGMVFR